MAQVRELWYRNTRSERGQSKGHVVRTSAARMGEECG